MATGTTLRLAEDDSGSLSLCPSLPPEKEREEVRQKPNHGPQDSQPLEMLSWGGLSKDRRGLGDSSGGLIPGPAVS